MPIKISETIERDCCQVQDLMAYQGLQKRPTDKYKVCKHCGQTFVYDRCRDGGAGGVDHYWREIVLED